MARPLCNYCSAQAAPQLLPAAVRRDRHADMAASFFMAASRATAVGVVAARVAGTVAITRPMLMARQAAAVRAMCHVPAPTTGTEVNSPAKLTKLLDDIAKERIKSDSLRRQLRAEINARRLPIALRQTVFNALKPYRLNAAREKRAQVEQAEEAWRVATDTEGVEIPAKLAVLTPAQVGVVLHAAIDTYSKEAAHPKRAQVSIDIGHVEYMTDKTKKKQAKLELAICKVIEEANRARRSKPRK